MQAILCKFECKSVTQFKGGENVVLEPVLGDANKPWSQYMPCGQFLATITNPAALRRFTPGVVYTIEITEDDPQ